MPATAKGSRHRPRVMVAMRPAVYELLTESAAKERRPASWELHNILLDVFVKRGLCTQEEADEFWADVIGRKDDDD